MKLITVRNGLVKESIIAGAVIAITIAITSFLVFERQSLQDKNAGLERETSLINNKIVKLEEEHNAFVQAFLKYSQIPLVRREGHLDDLPSRIAAIRPILETLKRYYRLSNLDATLSSVSTLGAPFEKNAFTGSNNTITFSFGGLSDELLLSFVDALTKQMPGYIRIETLQIKKEKNLDSSAYNEIQNRNLPTIVSGKMVFSWKTIKKK